MLQRSNVGPLIACGALHDLILARHDADLEDGRVPECQDSSQALRISKRQRSTTMLSAAMFCLERLMYIREKGALMVCLRTPITV